MDRRPVDSPAQIVLLEQLEQVASFAAKFVGFDLALTDHGDGRVLVQFLDEHGVPAGEKVV